MHEIKLTLLFLLLQLSPPKILYMFHQKPSIFTTLIIIVSFLLLQPSIPTLALLLSVSLHLLKSKPIKMMNRNNSSDQDKYSALEVEAGETSHHDHHHNHHHDHHDGKGKSPIMEAPLIGKAAAGGRGVGVAAWKGGAGVKRGVAIVDFVVRLIAVSAVLAATVVMGTTEQTLPFFTQFFQFQAKFDDLPTFTYFVIANALVTAYLVLSLPFSIVTIVRPLAKAPRLVLLTFDTVALTLTTSAAAASAAIVYLAHKGNTNTNWIAICQQFDSFCQRTSGAVVASFIGVVLFIFLVIISTVALKSH